MNKFIWMHLFFTACSAEITKTITVSGPAQNESQPTENQPTDTAESEQVETFDVIFVMDNSPGMHQEATALSQEIVRFTNDIRNLQPPVDVQVAITTTSVEHNLGMTNGIDRGEVGLFIGDTPNDIHADEFVSTFRQELLCNSTYWERNMLPRDPDYECGEDTTQISVEYLDCLCETTWDGIAGSATAEPLEAAMLAMCRAAISPPQVCYDDTTLFTEAEEGTASGFIRDNSSIIMVMLTDKGDKSRKIQQGDDTPSVYQQAFADFQRNIQFVTLGPNYNAQSEDIICNSGEANDWMAKRLITLAEESDGFFFPLEIYNNQGNCTLNYFSEMYANLAELLQ